MSDKKFVFIGGLHRSGTSLLHRCLRDHPEISGFSDTGFPQDEGMFLQNVYKPAFYYGGPGKFGFNSKSHVTEKSDLNTMSNRQRLFEDWSKNWDLNMPILLEKSPPNILKTRFLQAMFPGAYFVIIIRHPIATSFSTKLWSKTPIYSLFKHWVRCHDILFSDINNLENCLILYYEDVVTDFNNQLDKIYSFIGTYSQPSSFRVFSDLNHVYYENWRKVARKPIGYWYSRFLVSRFEETFLKFGYSLLHPEFKREEFIKGQNQDS